MKAQSQLLKKRESTIPALSAAIEAMNLAKELSGIMPAKAVFGSVSVTLGMIRDAMANRVEYVELGLACADVCAALDRGLNGKKSGDLNSSVYDAIKQLTTAVAEIQETVIKQGERNAIFRHLNAKSDKERIAALKLDLMRILQVFDTELAINTHATVTKTHTTVTEVRQAVVDTHTMLSELGRNATSTRKVAPNIHRPAVQGQGGSGGNNPPAQTSTYGEPPPLPPRTFFGRDRLIEKIVDFAESFVPIALIGGGGIGKTSIALAILHHDRIKQRFGSDRRFIRCDQFPASCAHFLRRLSGVIGACVENPKDLSPLRTFLSSKEMLVVLDNAESILDPQGPDGQEIYAIVEELSRFGNLCICITSRISAIPPDFRRLDIPTLSINAARDTFYRIYGSDDRSTLVNGILKQLDFHPLSIILLATVAYQNRWDMARLTREWERRRTSVLQTVHSKSLATTVELSLASPMFQELGPDARGLLEVIAFFPQGVDESNLRWLFPTVLNGTVAIDKFCILSLTYRSNRFVTMLAPLRDYLTLKDPRTSSLLRTAKERYFARMSVSIDPNDPNFGGTQWITSEDANVEYLLDVFTTIDTNSENVWEACANFMKHLAWHKKRLIVLGPKIEALPDGHSSKPRCLFELSRLLDTVGNQVERKRVLIHVLKLWRERGSDRQVTRILRHLSDANRLMGLHEEGMQLAKEALGIYERLGDTVEQARCLINLAFQLCSDKRLDAAGKAASRAIDLLPEKGEQSLVCDSHYLLGNIYKSKGDGGKAIHHFEVALGIASSFDWHDSLFRIYHSLAGLFLDGRRFDDAHAHLERAKLHAVNSPYNLGCVMEQRARIWYKQRRLEEAKSETLRAADVYGKLGAAKDLEDCRQLLRDIQMKQKNSVTSGQSRFKSR